MKSLEAAVNSPGTSAAFPRSRIKDDSGLNDGVPVDENVYGDVHQMLQKMAAEAGIKPNELLDSVVNGFQLFEAMRHTPDYVSLYMHGYFNELLSAIGATTGAFNKITVGLNRVYLSDNGDNDVKSFLFDGVASTVFDGGAFGGSPDHLQVVDSLNRLYVLDLGGAGIRAFELDTGNYIGAEDITAVVGAPVAFFVDPPNDRVYSHDSAFGIRVHKISDSSNVGGEEFGAGGGNTITDIIATPKRDRIYFLDNTATEVFVHLISSGAKQAAETFATTLTAPMPGFTIIGRKAYIIEQSPAVVTAWDIDNKVALPLEDAVGVPNTTRALFIHSGVMHLIEESSNTDVPIKCNAPTEYK